VSKASRRTTPHPYPRMARVNEVVREIIAEQLERIDDERLTTVAITEVNVDADLRNATVYFDTLQGTKEEDAATLVALADLRVKLQAAIGRESRMKRTPLLTFKPDDVLRHAERIETRLRDADHLIGVESQDGDPGQA
jgi:ribosome-binding factor A